MALYSDIAWKVFNGELDFNMTELLLSERGQAEVIKYLRLLGHKFDNNDEILYTCKQCGCEHDYIVKDNSCVFCGHKFEGEENETGKI